MNEFTASDYSFGKLLADAREWEIRNYQHPKITKRCRLRNVNFGHFDAYFDINDYRDSDGNIILKVQYLPEVHYDPYHHYYKSSTVKGGNFIYIKDICERLFGPEPEEGWHKELKLVDYDEDAGWATYKILGDYA